MSTIPSGQHLAAILPSKGARLEVVRRSTPSPGPNELLVEVKAVALNPVDRYQRDTGFFITEYPAVLCSDAAGTIIATGSSVTAEYLRPGTRVAAFATAFYEQGRPDYGALQKRVIVSAANVVPLPQGMGFNEASLLPTAVLTALSGWYTLGLARETQYTIEDKKGLLLWGGAGSVGSVTLQTAKCMGFIIYTTASEKHHEYLKELGASRVFDYKREDVVEQIIKTAKEDGISIDMGYNATPDGLMPCIEVLKAVKGEGMAKLAHAPQLPPDFSEVDGVEVKFVLPPVDAKERTEHFHFVFNVWLKENLANRNLVPSPKVRVIQGGLEAANEGLDEFQKGVSGVKMVLEI